MSFKCVAHLSKSCIEDLSIFDLSSSSIKFITLYYKLESKFKNGLLLPSHAIRAN